MEQTVALTCLRSEGGDHEGQLRRLRGSNCRWNHTRPDSGLVTALILFGEIGLEIVPSLSIVAVAYVEDELLRVDCFYEAF